MVIHDALGLSSAARRHADWMAEEGYLAIAPDLFAWDSRNTCLRSSVKALRERQGRQFDDIEAARKFVIGQPGAVDRTGIIGFCMGGAYALLLAPRADDYHAASVNYGRIPKDADQILQGACPVVASYGANDISIPQGAKRLSAALESAGVTHDVKEYPRAGHMFMDQFDRGEMPVIFSTLEKMFGMGYREGPAIDAQRRITAFFAEHLKGEAA